MKNTWFRRPSSTILLVVSYLIWASVSIRWITEFIEQDHPQLWLLSGMLVLYGLLLGLEPLITRGATWRAHLYLAFQTVLVFLATLLYYELDFFALLYLPVCGRAMLLFPRRTAGTWVGILIAVTVIGLIVQFGWPEALSFVFLYIAALFFVAAFSNITQQAEAARRRSETLLAQLQQANRQLQDYAGQAEKLAIANERNRLAGDLHDSVAQTLYGLTLQSETALRKLSAGDLAAVQSDLDEIQHSAQETLQEARLLIYELRPPVLEEEGLAAALQARLVAVEARSRLQVHADLQDVGRLSPNVETTLYRIVQEALNNVMKHAQAHQVLVSLHGEGDSVVVTVRDDGVGFDKAHLPLSGGLGLDGMSERAIQIGADLRIDSEPGQGTAVTVEWSHE